VNAADTASLADSTSPFLDALFVVWGIGILGSSSQVGDPSPFYARRGNTLSKAAIEPKQTKKAQLQNDRCKGRWMTIMRN
jgi:hypothetical protein